MTVLDFWNAIVHASHSDLKREADLFLVCEDLIPTGPFRVKRYLKTKSPEEMTLQMKMQLKPNFQYRSLSSLSKNSTEWRRKLQRYCCQKTGVSWRYAPDEKCAIIEGQLKTSRNPKKVRKTMEKVLEVLLQWAQSEHEQQGLL